MSAIKRKSSATTNGTDAKKPKVDGNIASFFGAPKPKPVDVSPAAPAVKFDKQKWVDGLTPEQKELLQLEIEDARRELARSLERRRHHPRVSRAEEVPRQGDLGGKEMVPSKGGCVLLVSLECHAARTVTTYDLTCPRSRHTPFNDVKVVIVGQDPYHNVNQAHGMAFSVRPPTPAPPSLKNMYIALKKDYPNFEAPPNKGGLLIPWADRGVLMLNTCLTVRAHEANSHSNRGWERFTQKVIDLVAQKRTRGVVFMAWGTPAGKRVQKVDKQRHLILQSVHPSPLSAARGFFDCGHFKKANEWLVSRYGDGRRN